MTGYNDDQMTVRDQYDEAVTALREAGFTSGIIEMQVQAKNHEACMQELLRRARRSSRAYADREEMKAIEMYVGLLFAARTELEWRSDTASEMDVRHWANKPNLLMESLNLHMNILRKLEADHELVELFDNYQKWEWLPHEIARRFRDQHLSFDERPEKPDHHCFANLLVFTMWTTQRLMAKREAKQSA